jgi:hypothetical protein
MDASPRVLGLLLLVLLAFGCDGGSASDDAGPPDAAGAEVALTVDDAAAAAAIGGVAPRSGYQFYILGVTLEVRAGSAAPVAAIAFSLSLEDGTRVTADAGFTNGITDGCRSQTVAVGSSVTCNVVFEVLADATAPRTLTWSDGTRSASAAVPALPMP